MNTLYRWMGIPETPPSWTADLIIEEEKALSFSKNLASFAILIGGFGALMTCCRGLVFKKISLVSIAISTALLAFGVALKWIANGRFQGLSSEDRKKFAIEELKKGLEQLPVCASEDGLEDQAKNHHLSSDTAMCAVERANKISCLAFPKYCPIRDLQPVFNVMDHLSISQSIDLLKTAYSKKIILEFPLDSCIHDNFESSPPNRETLIKMGNALSLSEAFLVNNFHRIQPFDQAMLNKQLEALCVHWSGSGGQYYASYPSFYVEDQQTLVIRNHLLSGIQMYITIRLLLPFFSSIKIELMKESLYMDHYNGNYSDDEKNCLKFDKQYLLQTTAPGKLSFIDRTNEQVDIWRKIH